MKNLTYINLFFIIIFISACSKKEEQPQKTEAPKTEDVKKVNPVDTAITTAKLPGEFPDDFPVYKNAKIISSTKGGTGPIVSMKSKDKASDVGNFYKTEMSNKGYNADKYNDKLMHDDGGIQVFTKDGKQYTISYHYNNDHTSITIAMTDVK